MSMFNELYQLALGATLTVTISADEKQGRMTLNVIPRPKTDAGEPALSTPLTLTASPEEFDAGFVEALGRYRGARQSLAEQAQVTQELLDAAKAASAKKGTGAVAKASARHTQAPAKQVLPASDDADEGEDAGGSAEVDEADRSTAVPAPPAAPGDGVPQLFG